MSCLEAGHLGKQVGGTKEAVSSYLIKLYRTAALRFGFNWRSLRSLLENLGDQEYAAAEGSRNIVDGAVIGVAESCRSMHLYDQSISLQRCWARENALKSRCNHCLAEKFPIEMQRQSQQKNLSGAWRSRAEQKSVLTAVSRLCLNMFSYSEMSESNCCECWDKFDSANFVQTFEMSWTSAIWALLYDDDDVGIAAIDIYSIQVSAVCLHFVQTEQNDFLKTTFYLVFAVFLTLRRNKMIVYFEANPSSQHNSSRGQKYFLSDLPSCWITGTEKHGVCLHVE